MMIEKVLKKINYYSIIALVLLQPIMFFSKRYFGVPVGFYFYDVLYIYISIHLVIYVYNLIKYKKRFDKYDALLIGLIVMGIIVTIFAVDTQTSIWGAYSRNEGLLALCSYYLLFLNSRKLSEGEIKNVIKCLFMSGIVQFIYCILQVFVKGDNITIFYYMDLDHMASGFIGNPNMLGSYCVLLVGLAFALYLIYKKNIYLILSIIFFANLILAASTGPFFAVVVLMIFMLIVLKVKKVLNIKKTIILLVSLVITFFVVSDGVEIYSNRVLHRGIPPSYTIKGDVKTTITLVTSPIKKLLGISNKTEEPDKDEPSNNITIENYGSGRLMVWKNTLKIVPKYFWLGAGIDNFGYVYPDHKYTYYDKAHNEYLQILVTEGIFTLVTYLSLLLCLFIDGLKSKNSLAWVLLFSFVGYALQAFLNISVNVVAPYYFIICGMLASFFGRKEEETL